MDVEARLKDHDQRLTRLEAAFDELVKGVSVYKNDKAYDEKVRK